MKTETKKLLLPLLLTLACAAPGDGACQNVGQPPPGYDIPKGPFSGFVSPVPRSGEVVVRFSPTTVRTAVTNLQRRLGVKRPSKRAIENELARLLGLRTSSKISGNSFVAKGLRASPSRLRNAIRRGLISRAEPNYKVNAFANPNDFLYQLGLLWGITSAESNGMSSGIDVDAPEAWNITQGASDLVVAVIDTGVFSKHPDLQENIWTNSREVPANNLDDDRNGYVDDVNGYDFVENDASPDDLMFHGTHCAGIIAAKEGNNRGICGVAPKVKILPLRVLNARGEGDTASVMKAVRYAIDLRKRGVNLRVINASLGGGEKLDIFEELLQEANRYGIVFVAAAGNDGKDNDEKPTYPANYSAPNLISVAAIDRTGNLATFSNFGERTVDVAAPGVGIWSTFLFGFYLPFDGTSMAAPFVSGQVALILSRRPSLSATEVIKIVKKSVKPIRQLEGTMVAPGIISVERALRSS